MNQARLTTAPDGRVLVGARRTEERPMDGLLGDTEPTALPWTAVTRARHAYDSVEILAPDGFCIARLVFGARKRGSSPASRRSPTPCE